MIGVHQVPRDTVSRRRVRRLWPLLVAGLVLGALGGCGDEPSYVDPSHVEGSGTPPNPTDAEAVAGSATVAHVMRYLDPLILTHAAGTTWAWSPLALTSTLAQVRAGSRGAVADQLDDLFGTDGGSDAFVRSVHAADETARRLDGPTGGANGELDRIDVRRGDALWGRSGTTWSPTFLDALTGGYGASMWMADFEGDPERARAAINQWVASQTDGQIDRLLPNGPGVEDTRLLATSALSFAAPWQTPMVALPDAPFTDRHAEVPTVDVPTIGVDAPLVVRGGPSWKAVTVPYVGGSAAMTVVIPDGGREPSPFELLAAVVPQLTAPADPSPVALSMPAFAIDTPLSGVTTPGGPLFTPGTDLFPMSSDRAGRPLKLDSFFQRTIVRVDERGTSLPPDQGGPTGTTSTGARTGEPFVVGGPFAFVIHDVATGTPLIVGWVREAPTSR